jgi:16S rRNA (cytosine967-C5)-methyltransferase
VDLVISPARQTCFDLLSRIEHGRLFSDAALNSPSMERMEIRDRHLTTEIVLGSLRWQALLDYVLAEASARSWSEVEPAARVLLRMSLYQMWRMDRIPDHALVNDAVELAKRHMKKGVDGYINGVLRRLARTRLWEKDALIKRFPFWIQVSLPEWLWIRWADRYGQSVAKEYALSLNAPPRMALRLLTNANTANLPFAVDPSNIVPGAYFRAHADKPEMDLSVSSLSQDEASQLIPHLLGDIQGCKVWDACAAPGGKSAILCSKCGVSGRVTASDLRAERIVRLANVLRCLNPNNADVLVADACASPPFRDCFDAVIADVPCSGLGTLRRNPEIKWHFSSKDLASLQQTQGRILNSVSETVRVGGRLLYSTCSTEPEENEQVIASFLDSHPGFWLERPNDPPGIGNWVGSDAMVRTFPSTHLWDGFFAALMVRRS